MTQVPQGDGSVFRSVTADMLEPSGPRDAVFLEDEELTPDHERLEFHNGGSLEEFRNQLTLKTPQGETREFSGAIQITGSGVSVNYGDCIQALGADGKSRLAYFREGQNLLMHFAPDAPPQGAEMLRLQDDLTGETANSYHEFTPSIVDGRILAQGQRGVTEIQPAVPLDWLVTR